jgi:hypothetical protein
MSSGETIAKTTFDALDEHYTNVSVFQCCATVVGLRRISADGAEASTSPRRCGGHRIAETN